MKTSAARIGLRVALVAMALGVSASLAGCIQSAAPLPGGTSKPSHTAMPTATSTPSPTGTPLAIDCDTLWTPAQVYAYNPNFVLDGNYNPKSGTVPSKIAAALGQTCGWINETSGEEIEVGVAELTADQLAAAKSAAAGGTPIDTAGNQGYFAVTARIGSAQFFYGSIWLVVSSSDFATAADASALYPIVVQNQRGLGG